MRQQYLIVLHIIIVFIPKCFVFNEDCLLSQWSSNATTLINSTYLNAPRDIYVDKNNILYVLDTGSGRIQRLGSNLTLETTFINVTARPLFNSRSISSAAISGDLNGNIYILDTGNARVIKWSLDNMNGTVVAGGNGYGNATNQLNSPDGMFIDVNTLFIWIADTYNSRIVRWESPSTGVFFYGSNGSNSDQFYLPFGLFVDTDDSNTLYVADTYNHRVQMWMSGATNGTTVAGQTGTYGIGPSVLYYPVTVIGDKNQNLFILSSGTDSIMKWKVGSNMGVLIVGTYSSGSSSNQLYFSYNFKFGPDNSIFVADTGNNRIQKFAFSCVNVTSITTMMTTKPTSTVTSRTASSILTTCLFNSTIMSMTTIQRSSSVFIDCFHFQRLSIIFSSIFILIINK
ncbi:unnamed protein product [Adineta ricciae]|uniref:NHL repeat containing protein n=1 Tax=Adineta ricciae TaxID=249248 RepID=A0A815U8W9_ADIRI|nr:unnamed protein product [Adineta ricciae]CAF1588781.1 unnamed protein product [Adineta ricciae]